MLPRLLLDATILAAAALLLGGSALVAAPFAYLLAAAFLLLPMRRALVVLAYLTAVTTAVFLATARSTTIIPSDWPLALSAVLVFTGALAALLVAALKALQASRAREREALEEALQASALKSQFVSMVSHELRTPLTSIAGFAEMLHDSWREIEDSQAEEYFRILLEETRHLADLVEDILVIPTLEAGELRLRPATFELAPVVERVAEMVFTARGDAPPVLEIPPDTGVTADPTRVQQVLRNLLENARKYGGDRVRASTVREGSRWVLSVEDDGPGIPESDRDRIFDHFERGSRQTQQSGIGLGLPIARRLARAMGGDLWLDDGPGPGACFRFSLPRAPVPEEAAPGPARAASS